MPTRRQELIDMLTRAPRTVRELCAELERSIRDVADDLAHVRRSLGSRFRVEPARCEQCGLTFSKRRRVTTPSRCPRCRSERIEGPWLSIDP